MFPVETIRGCPYTCRFCNSPDQMALYKNNLEVDILEKNSDLVHKELKFMKEKKCRIYLFLGRYFFSNE